MAAEYCGNTGDIDDSNGDDHTIKAEPFVLPRRLRYAFAMPAIRLADPIDCAAIEALVHEAYAVYVPASGAHRPRRSRSMARWSETVASM